VGNPADYERMVKDRQALVAAARANGSMDVPDPIRGPIGQLRKPLSGKIEDTNSIGAEGSWLIVKEARAASIENPLVVVVGGPLTTEADAYLLDPSIADKVIVAWLGGRRRIWGSTTAGTSWAAYIVLQKLRLVQFPFLRANGRLEQTQISTNLLPIASPCRIERN
jgi:hypothetical protein